MQKIALLMVLVLSKKNVFSRARSLSDKRAREEDAAGASDGCNLGNRISFSLQPATTKLTSLNSRNYVICAPPAINNEVRRLRSGWGGATGT